MVKILTKSSKPAECEAKRFIQSVQYQQHKPEHVSRQYWRYKDCNGLYTVDVNLNLLLPPLSWGTRGLLRGCEGPMLHHFLLMLLLLLSESWPLLDTVWHMRTNSTSAWSLFWQWPRGLGDSWACRKIPTAFGEFPTRCVCRTAVFYV